MVCTLSPLLLHKSQHTGTFVAQITKKAIFLKMLCSKEEPQVDDEEHYDDWRRYDEEQKGRKVFL